MPHASLVDRLPRELIELVLQRVGRRSAAVAACTCREFRDAYADLCELQPRSFAPQLMLASSRLNCLVDVSAVLTEGAQSLAGLEVDEREAHKGHWLTGLALDERRVLHA